MTIDDLKNFTEDEIKHIFVELINEMEHSGQKAMDIYEKDDDIAYHTYGSALMSRVNRMKAIVTSKNNKIRTDEIISDINKWIEENENKEEEESNNGRRKIMSARTLLKYIEDKFVIERKNG